MRAASNVRGPHQTSCSIVVMEAKACWAEDLSCRWTAIISRTPIPTTPILLAATARPTPYLMISAGVPAVCLSHGHENPAASVTEGDLRGLTVGRIIFGLHI